MRTTVIELTCDRCLKVESIEIIDKDSEFQISTEGWTKKDGQDLCPRCSGNVVACINGKAVRLEPVEVPA